MEKRIFKIIFFLITLILLIIIIIKFNKNELNEFKNNTIQFPEDEFPHSNVSLEWWYFNSHLKDQDGHNFGIMNLIHQSGSSTAIIIDKDNQNYYFFNNNSDFKPISTNNIQWEILKDFNYVVKSSFKNTSTSFFLRSEKKVLIPIESLNRNIYYNTNMYVEGNLTLFNKLHILTGKGLIGHAWVYVKDRDKKDLKFEWMSIHLDNDIEIILSNLFFDNNSKKSIFKIVNEHNDSIELYNFTTTRSNFWKDQSGHKWNDEWKIKLNQNNLNIELNIKVNFREKLVPNKFRETTAEVSAKIGKKHIKGTSFISTNNPLN